jgi:hypothetical protein
MSTIVLELDGYLFVVGGGLEYTEVIGAVLGKICPTIGIMFWMFVLNVKR